MATPQQRTPATHQHDHPLPEKIPSNQKTFGPWSWGLVRIIKKEGMISHEKALYVHQGAMNCFSRRGFLVRVKEGYAPSEKYFRAIDEIEHTEVVKEYASENLGRYVAMLRTVRSIRN